MNSVCGSFFTKKWMTFQKSIQFVSKLEFHNLFCHNTHPYFSVDCGKEKKSEASPRPPLYYNYSLKLQTHISLSINELKVAGVSVAIWLCACSGRKLLVVKVMRVESSKVTPLTTLSFKRSCKISHPPQERN